MKYAKLITYTLCGIALFGLALAGGWAYQSGTFDRWLTSVPPSVAEKTESKIKQDVSTVLDSIVGHGKYYVTVKATMTDKSEEVEKVNLVPGIVTDNQSTQTSSESERDIVDPESIKAKAAQRPVQKITKPYPGFPVLNEVNPDSTKIEPTKNIHLPAKSSSKSQDTEIYFSQEKIKQVVPIAIKKIDVHVVVDERKMKLQKINPAQLSSVLAQVAGINEDRGDQLVLSSYKFSDTIIGLDQFYLNTKDRIRQLDLPPEFFVLLFIGFWIFCGLMILVWAWRRRKKAQRALAMEKRVEIERLSSQEEQDREKEFQALCRSLLDFVERNPGFTASTISEMVTSSSGADETNSLLSPLKKVLIFILFLEAEKPEVVQVILTEVGESLSKSLLQGANKYMKVDSAVLRTVLKEFYHLLVKKQYLIGGPTISQKILKTAFGTNDEDSDLIQEFSFQFLDKVSDDRLLHFLVQEQPQLTALVFSFLDENRVVTLLSQMDVDRAVIVSRLMLTLDVPNYHLVQKLSQSMEIKLLAPEVSIDEQEKLVKISRVLEKLSTELREKLMTYLETGDRTLVEKMKALIYTFEDLESLSDEHLQMVLFEVDIRTIGVAMLNCEGPLRTKITRNLSDRMKQVIIEMEQLKSSIKQSEIEKSHYAILKVARKMADEERIIFQKKASE